MIQKELRERVSKPQIARLKAIGPNLKVGLVMGERVLVIDVDPFTEMDKVEEQGLLVIPEQVKKENTPLPTTGIIVQLGIGLVGSNGAGEVIPVEDIQTCLGEARRRVPFNEGEMVMFSKFAGTEFMIVEERLRIMDVREIICTLVDTREEVKEVSGDVH